MKIRLILLLVALSATPLTAAELKPLPMRPAPALKLSTLDGAGMDLKQWRGKVVLVNFWAVWCPPCRKEMPSMARLMTKFTGKPFVILGVNEGEGPGEIRAFLKQVPVNFPILLDNEGEHLKPWQVFAFPTSYVIDKQGRLRLGLFGSIEWDSPDAVSQLEKLLGEAE
jgi:thiol-disulfide isomerase/thioredoxin